MNPRRPTPSGPQPDPFDLARAPPHHEDTVLDIRGFLELTSLLYNVVLFGASDAILHIEGCLKACFTGIGFCG